MKDWRYATPEAPHCPASQAQHRARRSRLRHWRVVCAALLVTSCQPTGILDPQGPIASAERLLLINST
ncbi:MAG TPA: hypothetical protein VNN75_02050, partial [Stellaceae bacterium]|nr:hypothetical protein [Stellaceae bacterium]